MKKSWDSHCVADMEKNKIDRINELAALAKERELTASEAAERKALREEYLAEFRAHLRGTLDNTVIERPDGTRERIKPKTDKENK